MSTDSIVDRFLTGNFSEEYALKLFLNVSGFTIQELQDNVDETLNILHSMILQIQKESVRDKYILECIILSTFLTKDDDICTGQLLTICKYFSHYNNLKHIRIIECDVTNEMLETICQYFTDPNTTKCKLELIDIGYNLITDKGIKILSETLIPFHCKTMKNIMCAANYMTDLGVLMLSKAVKLCSNIEFVDISQQQSSNDDYIMSPISNCLPLLESLINKEKLKGIELFDCGIVPINIEFEQFIIDQLCNQSAKIFKDLLTTTPNLKVLQLGRSKIGDLMDNPSILKGIMDAFIDRGKLNLKKISQYQLLPLFQQSEITKDITLGIIEIIRLHIFDFYDDKFHLVLSQNAFKSDTILPVLIESLSSRYFCLGRIDLTGNIFTFEQIVEIGKAMMKNATLHSISFDVSCYKNGDKLTWNWADKMRSNLENIYFVKGSSKDIHRGGLVRSDHSKIYWSTILSANTHVCDKSRGGVYA